MDMLSCGSPFNCPSMSRKRPSGFLCKLKESLTDEWKSRISNGSAVNEPSPTMAVHVTVHDLAVAIQPLLSQLRGFLRDDGAGTIGIMGLGGVGKTTILKALNNQFLRRINKKWKFHVVIFAPIPRDSNIKRLQEVVARRLSLPCQENESLEITAIRISMALRKKRFVLLLDDLKRPLDLTEIGIPLPDGQNRCKLIFTTRSESVVKDMKADKVVAVKPFDSEGSWELFQRCAGEKASSPEISDVAKNFARECGGLAFALITVGRSLASVFTREEWMRWLEIFKHLKQHLLSAINNESSTEGMESTTLLPYLYFSYNMLGPDEKNCLLYCSLYPKNHSIEKEELIRYWMGEGLILKEQDSIDGARKEGYKLITKLKSLGMLDDGYNPDSEVFMHDTMHDLALRIIKKESLVQAAGQELIKVPKGTIYEDTKKVSLMYNAIETLDQLPACPHLQSLILRRNLPLGEIKHDLSLFESSSSLGLLDLSYTRLKKIPSEIGKLVQLRHLDLSFTKIKVLPQEIGNLVNLVQLLLEGTHSLATIPGGIIPKLTKVLVLNLYDSYGDWEVAAATFEENTHPSSSRNSVSNSASIEELKCLKQLDELGITICSTRALESFVDSSTLTKSTKCLLVNECEDLQKLHLSKSSFEKLQQVTISDCGTLKELIVGGSSSSSTDERNDGRDWRLSNIEVLRFKSLYNMVITWRGLSNYSECLPKLRELDISFCNELVNVSWVLELGCLERIKLNSCKRIEHVVEASLSAGQLPRLKTMTLRNLPRLKSISDHPLSFPLLESVKVFGCPQLRSLPQRTGGDSSPVFVYGEVEWWNAVEWSSGKEKRPSFWYFRATKELY